MPDPDPDPEVVICFGGATPGDQNFATIVAVDNEIFDFLRQRERRRRATVMSVPGGKAENICSH